MCETDECTLDPSGYEWAAAFQQQDSQLLDTMLANIEERMRGRHRSLELFFQLVEQLANEPGKDRLRVALDTISKANQQNPPAQPSKRKCQADRSPEDKECPAPTSQAKKDANNDSYRWRKKAAVRLNALRMQSKNIVTYHPITKERGYLKPQNEDFTPKTDTGLLFVALLQAKEDNPEDKILDELLMEKSSKPKRDSTKFIDMFNTRFVMT